MGQGSIPMRNLLKSCIARHYSAVAAENSRQKSLQYLSKVSLKQHSDGNCQFFFNDKPLKFGEFQHLIVPSKLMGQIILNEWFAKVDKGGKLEIPSDLLKVLAIHSDLLSRTLRIESVCADIFEYLKTDTLIYWSGKDSEIFKIQDQEWGPALRALENGLNIPKVRISQSLLSINQDSILVSKFSDFLTGLSCFELASFYNLVKSSKSALLPWGLAEQVFSPDQFVSLSLLELRHQAREWGSQPEYHELKVLELKKTAYLSSLFFKH